MARLSSSLIAEYGRLWEGTSIVSKHRPVIDLWVKKMVQNKSRYEAVSKITGVPWYVIAAIHIRESSMSFKGHLHNGDPLTRRTRQVPAGRPLHEPKAGAGRPYTWEESAVDALRHRKLHEWSDWSVPGMLYVLEGYNGFGYRNNGRTNPYLWSYTNQYTSGKYVKDGKYNPSVKDKQPGTAAILKHYFNLYEEGATEEDGQYSWPTFPLASKNNQYFPVN